MKRPNNQQQTRPSSLEETMETQKRDTKKADDGAASQGSYRYHKKSCPVGKILSQSRGIHRFQAKLKHLPKRKTKVVPVSSVDNSNCNNGTPPSMVHVHSPQKYV
jgi:hypothetical protein